MPKGNRHVPCARAMPSLKSAAVNSSQCTESLVCGAGCCAPSDEAQKTLMESRSDLRTFPPLVAAQFALQKICRRRVGPQPVGVQQEIVDVVGENQLLHRDVPGAQR